MAARGVWAPSSGRWAAAGGARGRRPSAGRWRRDGSGRSPAGPAASRRPARRRRLGGADRLAAHGVGAGGAGRGGSCRPSSSRSTSDLKMRMERPRLRAASGSRFQPKSRTTTTMRMTTCHPSNKPLPMAVTPSVLACGASCGRLTSSVYVPDPCGVRALPAARVAPAAAARGCAPARAGCRPVVRRRRAARGRVRSPSWSSWPCTRLEPLLGGHQLAAELLDLPPQGPQARAEVDQRAQHEDGPDQHPPPHGDQPTRRAASVRSAAA